jgi:hypothetical protein
VLHFDLVPDWRLLNQHADSVEALGNFPDPAVAFESCKSRCYSFIKSVGGDLHRVLDVANIPNRNLARSQYHEAQDSIFAFYSL